MAIKNCFGNQPFATLLILHQFLAASMAASSNSTPSSCLLLSEELHSDSYSH
jgi:hypothetical protein